ncbi:MAG: flippase-like domain-containing protein [Alphaproteobacteria bacterium]|jgi:uncharacterized protein (TIRG00374 family)|nr:flippase-like domain-containing protein [Alphaproteobacteria bacterium]MDP6660148.1 flippase-like domain-containing protein [Alphaproteobacteria bacterium]MDP6780931.1 flippase-like domain-containing protein [Alphaproteobacteria bacterium]MDP7044016.1 flippase-like domain-containing protein [Alphaproteobacteria bacterium]
MKTLRILFLLLGLALLTAIVARTDLTAVAGHVEHLKWGFLAVLGVYLASFLADTLSWQYLIRPFRCDWPWFYALWKVRMVGAAVSRVTPFVGLAGEPVKAVLMKNFLGLDYREGVASLVVAKTANLMALVVFLCIGLALTIASGYLSPGYQLATTIGLAVLMVGIAVVFAVQRLKVTSTVWEWLSRRRFGRRLARVLHHIQDLDDRLVESYDRDHGKFLLALALTFVNWVLGAVELYLILWFFGHPVSVAEAWCIEAVVELARAGAFFIPAGIGVQEGAMVLIITPITGQPSLGLAVALVRRLREIIWIGWGFLIAWRYSIPTKPPTEAPPGI